MTKQTTGEPLGFSYQRCSFASQSEPDVKRAVFRAKKILEGIVHDTVALEGNPFTFPEAKTLMEGITVGGHRVEDANQVLNQAQSWRRLFHLVENKRFSLSEDTAMQLHALVAKEEAPSWGVFRDGPVGIGGTNHRPPPHENCRNCSEKARKRCARSQIRTNAACVLSCLALCISSFGTATSAPPV